MKDNPAIEEAYLKAGGRKAVQKSLKVTKATLSDWKRAGHVPPGRCVELERLSGVSRRRLHPTFEWGPERAPKAAKVPAQSEQAGV